MDTETINEGFKTLYQLSEELWILDDNKALKLPIHKIKIIQTVSPINPHKPPSSSVSYGFINRHLVRWFPQSKVFKTKAALLKSL